MPLRLTKCAHQKIALLLPFILTLAACSTPPAPITRGEAQSAPISPSELAQFDSNRMATQCMRDNLASRKNAQGLPLLLSDEINERERNLSFEREFGKVIGRLDLLASLLTEKYRRAVITYVQNLLGGTFLQFLPVR